MRVRFTTRISESSEYEWSSLTRVLFEPLAHTERAKPLEIVEVVMGLECVPCGNGLMSQSPEKNFISGAGSAWQMAAKAIESGRVQMVKFNTQTNSWPSSWTRHLLFDLRAVVPDLVADGRMVVV